MCIDSGHDAGCPARMNSNSRNSSILPESDIESAQSRRFMIPLVNCDQPGRTRLKSVPRLRCISFVSRKFNSDLIGRSRILLLVQCDSTGENVKQILIVSENRIAMTRSSDGTRHWTFLGDSSFASIICGYRKFGTLAPTHRNGRTRDYVCRNKSAERDQRWGDTALG